MKRTTRGHLAWSPAQSRAKLKLRSLWARPCPLKFESPWGQRFHSLVRQPVTVLTHSFWDSGFLFVCLFSWYLLQLVAIASHFSTVYLRVECGSVFSFISFISFKNRCLTVQLLKLESDLVISKPLYFVSDLGGVSKRCRVCTNCGPDTGIFGWNSMI